MAALFWISGVTLAFASDQPVWSGGGRFRVLVRVPPVGEVRESDELVAKCEFPLDDWLRQKGVDASTDIASFQVHRYEPRTGKPEQRVRFESSRSPYDCPCRFEDTLHREASRSRVGRASETEDGRPSVVMRVREDRLFNREHRTDRGSLVWSHKQLGDSASYYAIYFDVLPEKQPWGVPPSPWIGDGAVLRRERGESLGGFSHFTATIGDWNGDMRFDIVAGNEKGDLFWYPNHGRVGQPEFLGCRLLVDETGPIDTGWYAAPVIYDWDSDGLKDLVVGTSGNVILWWRNEGTKKDPSLKYRGFVEADGKRLEVPEEPVAEDPRGIFARDYYNQPWIGDLNDDGFVDLVTGGYTTGRLFWYSSQKQNVDRTPALRYEGPVEDVNGPIDTIWGAAPALCDFNQDGSIDLLSGAWWWSGIHRDPELGETDLLWYFRGLGQGAPPRFAREPFPANGDFPPASIARPNVVDANDDGLDDLFVSESGGDAYIFLNVGAKTSPRWDLRSEPLTVPWGFTRDFDIAASTADVNGDGTAELLIGNVITSVTGCAASPETKTLGVAHCNGQPIRHPGPGYGDPYYFSILYDWDSDGHPDILWGTQQGNIYLHRSLGSSDPLAFSEGVQLQLVGGAPLEVGPPVVDSAEEAKDFTVLQGSRIVFNAADFDTDGIVDLLVGDTFSNVWIFRGLRRGATDAFEPRILLTKLATRPEAIACTDWNGDGLEDLLIGGTAERPCVVYYNSSEPGRPRVKEGTALEDLPYLFWGPKLRATDWNADGDVDLMVQSEFFSFFLERSFLDHGYQTAVVMRPDSSSSPVEEKPSAERSP